ncbi:amino acid adenylation domain-containing protein, partial [Roseateles flavus]
MKVMISDAIQAYRTGRLSLDALVGELRGAARESQTAQALSEGQRGIWALQKRQATSQAYTIPLCFAVRNLDLDAFRRACRHVVRQYPILHSAIQTLDGEPRRVMASGAFPEPVLEQVVDLLGAGAERAAIVDHLHRQIRQPFSLEVGPLLRIHLLGLQGWQGQDTPADASPLTSDHTLVALHVHHIVFDGQSMVALVTRLFETYRQAMQGQEPVLQALDETFDDFVREEQALLASEEGARRLAYWQEQLAQPAPPLRLSLGTPRAARAAQGPGACLSVPLAPATSGRVDTFLQGQQLSASTLFLGVLHILLHRYSGESDLVIGMPVDARGAGHYRSAMGLFINMLPLRTRLQPDHTALALFKQLHRSLIDGIALQLPFAALVRQLGLQGQGEGSPLFDIAFMHQDFLARLPADDADVTPMPEFRQEGVYELVLEVHETQGSSGRTDFTLHWKSRPGSHDEAALQTLARHYAQLLDSVLSEPSTTVGRCAMLAPAEQRQLLALGSDTAVDYPRDARVPQLIDRHARHRPDAEAVRCGARSLSYRQLKEASDALARQLRQRGLRTGDRVAVQLRRSTALVVGLLAVWKASGVYVPLDPDYPEDWADAILRDSTPRILLTESALQARLRAVAGQASAPLVITLDAEPADDAALEAGVLEERTDATELAYVIYTSGSTGKPKGVMIPHGALTNFLLSMATRPGLAADDTLLAVTTCSFDIAVLELFLPLVQGARCVLSEGATARDGAALRALIQRTRPTVMQATPSTWELLLHSGWRNEEGLKVLCGGDAMSASLKGKLLACSDEVWNLFGPTETTVWSTVARVRAEEPVHVGHPIANTRVRIIDPHGQLVPVGVAGELCIAGDGLAAGYLNRPEETRARFVAGFEHPAGSGRLETLYRTGDLARWRPDGSIEHLGRIDFQVKIRGHRVELQTVEHHLGLHPALKAAAVVARQQEGVHQLVAYCVPHTAGTPDDFRALARQLRSQLSAQLPDYMVPSLFLPLESLPMTNNGKVNRKELADRPVSLHAGLAPARPPAATRPRPDASSIEARLLALCAEVLKITDMSVTDGFFEAGADSVTIAVIADRALLAFQPAALDVGDFFKHPNVAALAALLAQRLAQTGEPTAGAITGERHAEVGGPVADAAAPGGARPLEADDALAIVGMSCELPGAADHREFWRNLARGWESARFFSPEELRAAGVPESRIQERHYVPMQQTLDGKDLFDRAFFNLTSKDAQLMDPQFRLLLQHAWKAIEDAGYTREAIADAGVYMSASNSYYQALLNQAGGIDATDEYQAWLLAQGGTIPTRISYELGLTGPSLFVHSNCSSGPVSLALAAQALRTGECRHALVGASTVLPQASIGYVHQPGLNLSSDGHCRTFDAQASGLTPGEGVVVLMLKRARDAVADGDHIYALLRGIAVNNDGADKVGFYAPSVGGQSRVIQKVLDATGIHPETIGYVEAHGTGTKLGDPVEVAALTEVYRRYSEKRQFCAIGSVKPNIGHLDTVAGLSGCVKVALSLAHGEIPPSINCEVPNPAIDFQQSPFFVARALQAWPASEPGGRRRAALSSFGIGGTNVHLIMEAAEPVTGEAPAVGGQAVLVPLSAKNPDRLKAQASQLLAFLAQEPAELPALDRLAYTLQVGREAMASRVAFVVDSHLALAQALDAFVAQGHGGAETGLAAPGQGAQGLARLLSDDQGMEGLIRGWVEAGSLSKIAAVWTQGVDLDWRLLHPHGRPQRASLPTYPFAAERFAPLQTLGAAGGPVAAPRQVPAPFAHTPRDGLAAPLHPMLQEVLPVEATQPRRLRLRSRFSGQERFLADHMIRGRRLLPGVAYLEMARAAAAIARGDGRVRLQSVVWMSPMVVDQPAEVVLSLDPDADLDDAGAMKFTVSSGRADGSTPLALNCQGAVRFGPGMDSAEPARVDLSALRARCPRRVAAERFYEYLDSGGGNYGPSFKTISALFKGEKEVLASLSLPAAAQRGDAFGLHPSMMDAAFQIADSLILQPRANGGCLPFFVKELVVWRPMGEQAHVHVRLSDDPGGNTAVARYDIDFLNAEGQVCVSIREFSARAETADGDANANRYWVRRRGDGAAPQAAVAARRPARRFVPVEPERWMLEMDIFRTGGVYWITGACSGLALNLACHLGQVPGASLVLTDLQAPDSAWLERLQSYLVNGARLEFMAGDPAADGQALVERIRQRHGPITGVLACTEAATPPAQGRLLPEAQLRALDEATRAESLDFFIALPVEATDEALAPDAAILAWLDERDAWVKVGIRHGRSAAVFCPEPLPMPLAQPLLQGIASRQVLTVVQALHFILHQGESAMIVGWKPGSAGQGPDKAGPLPVATAAAAPVQADSRAAAPASAEGLAAFILRLKSEVAEVIKSAEQDIDEHQNFGDYGLDSLSLTALSNRLNERLSLGTQAAGLMNPTTFFERPTLLQIAEFMLETYPALNERPQPAGPAAVPAVPAIQQAAAVPPTVWAQAPSQAPAGAAAIEDRGDDVAIIGMSGRFPGARDVSAFARNLFEGRDCITEVPADRWDWRACTPEAAEDASLPSSRWGGFIDGLAEFDPLFFNISPREAYQMDPSHRQLLMHAWWAIEDAGYNPRDLAGSKTALFVGVAQSGYSDLRKAAGEGIEGNSFLGVVPSIAINRISHFLDLHGPSEPVETACSSSLVALHRAVVSLACGDAELALVGGMQTILTPHAHISFGKAGMLAPDGRCKTFSAQADGFVRGEGVGMLFLKRLSAARRDGDAIHGIVRGSAVNHGGHSNTLTAPNPTAQREVIVQAHARAAVDPRTIGYLEAHGTGTKLGDPIEINALKQAFAERLAAQPQSSQRRWDSSCALGALKTNVGHLELAAGVAGVIKVLLQMKHGQRVRSLHCEALNPYIDLTDSPFFIPRDTLDWPRIPDADGQPLPRRAGVSSFGIGGVNAHVVLEEPMDDRPAPAGAAAVDAGPAVVLLSAKTSDRLIDAARALRQYVQDIATEAAPGVPAAQPAPRLADLAYTLQVGREAMPERVGFVVASWAELQARLAAFVAGQERVPGMARGRVKVSKHARAEEAAGMAGLDRLLDIWIDGRKLEALLDAWVKGASIPWTRLHEIGGSLGVRRVHLPGYPFARERYWISESAAVAASGPETQTASVNAGRSAHPLLPATAVEAATGRARLTLSGQEDCLRDHQVQGDAVLPGVAQLELVHEAVRLAWPSGPGATTVRLSNVAWIRPVRVNSPVTLLIEPPAPGTGPGRFSVQIEATGGEHFTCCEGVVGASGPEEGARLDLASLQAAFAQAEVVDPALWYAAFERVGIVYGPSHRGLASCRVNEAGVLARVRLPVSQQAAAGRFTMHPGLLDAVLQAAIGLRRTPAHQASARLAYLPFALDTVEVLRACGDAVWAWLRPAAESAPAARRKKGEAAGRPGADKIDIDVCDDSGAVCVRMRGLSSRALHRPGTDSVPATTPSPDAAGPRPASDTQVGLLMRSVLWNPKEVPTSQDSPLSLKDRSADGTGMLVLGGTREEQQAIQGLFPACQLSHDAADGQRPQAEAALARALARGQPVNHIVWIAPASLDTASAAGPQASGEAILAAQEQGVLALYRHIKMLLAAGYGAKDLAWTLLTQQTHATSPGDRVIPTHAGIHGLVGAMAKEYRTWKVRLLDLQAARAWPLGAMFSVPFDPEGNAWAWRDGCWLARELVAVQDLPAGDGAYRRGGVYVVIGGAGGIGMAWSRWMIEQHQARIVWIGRRPEDAAIRRQCEALGRLGTAPVYLCADASDRDSLAEAHRRIAALRWDGQALATRGVIHSAIVLADASLATMDEPRFLSAWRSKADVSVQMAAVFGADPLDFMVFFSSITAYGKTAGQSNYAAGCTFKDAFATWLDRTLPFPVKVVNWGYWGSVGVVSDASYRERMAAAGFGSIEPDEGMRALEALLASRLPQVAVLKTLRPGVVGRAAGPAEERILHYRDVAGTPASQATALQALDSALQQCAQDWTQRAADVEPRSPELDALIARALLWGMLPFLDGREAAQARHGRWLEESLSVLQEQGSISPCTAAGGQAWQVSAAARAQALSAWADWEQQAAGWPQNDYRRIPMKLAEVCLRALPDILAGRQLATEVMFPGSSMALVEGLYKGNRKADLFNEMVHDAVLAIARSAPSPLRVLEVGAGTGGTTAGLLRKIADRGVALEEYVYTDLSHAFLMHARQHYAPIAPFLKTQIFNAEKAIEGQGIEAGRFDVVIATNVLHATQNIRQTLRNVKATLRAGGLLVLNEISHKTLFSHVTFGLLDGWWNYDDAALRIPGSPGLYQDSWRQVLQDEGYERVLFPGEALHVHGQQLVIAQSNGLVRASFPVAAATATPQRQEALVPPAPAAPDAQRAVPPAEAKRPLPTPMAPAVPAQVPAPRDGTLADMQAYLRRKLSEVLQLPQDRIETDASFASYGTDSIMAMALIRELEKDLGSLPKTLFFEHEDIEELSAYLLERGDLPQAVDAPQAAAAAPAALAPAATPAPASSTLADMQAYLRRKLSEVLQLPQDRIETDASFASYGTDSIMA